MIVNKTTSEMTVGYDSTTNMPDRDFIDTYELQIMSDFASHPYFLEFEDRQEWTDKQIARHKNEKELKQKS